MGTLPFQSEIEPGGGFLRQGGGIESGWLCGLIHSRFAITVTYEMVLDIVQLILPSQMMKPKFFGGYSPEIGG